MKFFHTIRSISCLLSALTLVACTTPPKRGDMGFEPAMPIQKQVVQQYSDSIYQQNTAWLLHEDRRARMVGDMLTVMLEEQTDAAKKAETGTSKASSVNMPSPTILGGTVTHGGRDILVNSIEADQSFDGSGESKQSNSLSGSVTVTVVEVLSNGHMVVQGEKWININQGEEYVRVKGIVRPMDVNPDNTISSVRIANAQIQYGGDGDLNNANQMGWLTRFFNSKWMPF